MGLPASATLVDSAPAAAYSASRSHKRKSSMVYCQPGLFLRYDPVTEPLPILVDVSRSGREYPNDMRSPVSFSAIHDNVSMWLDDLYDSAPRHGATMLYCTIAHMYIDMNRAETDFDPAILEGEWPVPLK